MVSYLLFRSLMTHDGAHWVYIACVTQGVYCPGSMANSFRSQFACLVVDVSTKILHWSHLFRLVVKSSTSSQPCFQKTAKQLPSWFPWKFCGSDLTSLWGNLKKVDGAVLYLPFRNSKVSTISICPLLQTLIERVQDVSKKYGMEISIPKTKAMIFSHEDQLQVNMKLDDTSLDQVNRFKYLGVILTQSNDPTSEIKSRLLLASTALGKLQKVWNDRTSHYPPNSAF